MNVSQEKTGELTAVLNIQIENQDYEAPLKKAIKSYAKQAQLKGFRPGKAPIGMIKKMFGNQLLADQLDQLIQKGLYDYLAEEKLDILGNPIALPAPNQDLDANSDKAYEFGFEIGLRPDFDIYGMKKGDHTFERKMVKVEDELVANEIENLQKRYGAIGTVEGDTKEDDILKVLFVEQGPVETGVVNQTQVLISTFKEESRPQLLGASVGDKISLNVFELMDKDREAVGRHLLGINDAEKLATVGDQFEMEIQDIQRMNPAEKNQEFFDKIFGPGEVEGEEAFVKKVKEQLQEGYNNACEGLLNNQVIDTIVEKTEMAMPEEFLKKWMAQSNSEDGEKQLISDEAFASMRDCIKWQLIRAKLVHENELKVEDKDLLERAIVDMKRQLAQYMPQGFPDDQLEEYAQKMLKDPKYREETANRLLDEKVIDSLRNQITTKDVDITVEEFNALNQKEQ